MADRLLAKPWLWGTIYLVLVPVFALIYFWLPWQSFYHSSSEYDVALDEHSEEILADLHEQMLAALYGKTGTTAATFEGWTADLATAEFLHLWVEGRYWLNVEFVLTARQASEEQPAPTTLRFITLRVPIRVFTSAGDEADIRYLHGSLEGSEGFPVPPAALFPSESRVPHFSQSRSRVVLPVTDALLKRMLFYCNARTGWSSHAPGGYLRMLYLSVVTMTTLGYGDIVPTTTAARTWVASQSIIGIIMIGLFVNAVVQRARNG